MSLKNPRKMAGQALGTLSKDRKDRLLRIDSYVQGDQDQPFTPDSADEEFKLLAKRSVTNVFPFLLGTPAQMMKADSFRRGRTSGESIAADAVASLEAVQPEWDHWQKSRLDARQLAVYRGALQFGHSFVLTELDKKKGVLSKGLSALKTIAMYEDPANDDDAIAAITVTRWPSKERKDGADTIIPGLARMWDDTYEYPVTFESMDDPDSIRVAAGKRHGSSVCPVTRFVAAVDLEGRTVGIVEPMFVLQDRINQTVFDLLIVQSFASFKVKTIAGLAPPIKMKPVDIDGNTVENPEYNEDKIDGWVPSLDPRTGQPIPDAVNLNAKRVFWAEDNDTKFGTLDETPLNGFIDAIELAFRHMAALSQTPPHHILGEISNLSAEALEAAELSLSRKVDEFKTSFGESWERVFRVAAEIGDFDGVDDYSGEVIWRDMGNTSLAQTADALLKLRDLGVPARGLFPRIPNVTANETAMWEEMIREEDPGLALGTRAGSGEGTRPSFRRTAAPTTEEAPAA